MKRIEPIEQLKWIVVSLPLAAGFSYSLFSTLSAVGFGVPDRLIDASPGIGTTVALGWWLVYDFDLIRSQSRQRRKPDPRQAQVELITPDWSPDPDVKRSKLKWKEDKYLEFDFHGLGLPGRIPESTFHRFVRLAYRRQTNALYGSKVNMIRGADGEFRRLTANQIFTRNYFCQDCRPRFLDEDYNGCLYILTVCRVLIGRGQGRGGLFRGEYGPDKIVDICKDRWLKLLSPYPGQVRVSSFLNFWRNLPTR